MLSKLNEESIKLLKKQLKKEITNLEENKMNNSRVLDILEQLSKVTINTTLLVSTKIGKVVNKLKNKSSNDSIVEASSKLINKWKAIARGEKSSNNNGSSSSTTTTTTNNNNNNNNNNKPSKMSTPIKKPSVKTEPYKDNEKHVHIPESVNSKNVCV